MSRFSSVFLSRQGTTQTCTSPGWYRNYMAQQQMQSTPWCPGQPDLLVRLQHNLLEELRASWWLMNPHDLADGGEDEKQALPCDPSLLHRDGFFVVMTTRLLGKTHFFTAYRRSVFSETAWQSPGSYRQVSSLKHPLYSCERSPRAVSNTEEDSSAVTLDFKQSSQNMTDTDIQYATHNLTNTFMSKQSTYEWKDSFRCLAEFG